MIPASPESEWLQHGGWALEGANTTGASYVDNAEVTFAEEQTVMATVFEKYDTEAGFLCRSFRSSAANCQSATVIHTVSLLI